MCIRDREGDDEEAFGGGLDGEAGEEAAEGSCFLAELLVFVGGGQGRIGDFGGEEDAGGGVDVAAEDGGPWAVGGGWRRRISGQECPRSLRTVSYTHLDVYKRQTLGFITQLRWSWCIAERIIEKGVSQKNAVNDVRRDVQNAEHCLN